MRNASIVRKVSSLPVSDGAGVRLQRIIGQPDLDMVDPFLLLDEFGTDKPEDYLAGFPSHPHRGFETVTYMLEGRMRHKDNLGNEGVLSPGSVQWMTAGKGVIHSEMPEQKEGRLRGFQLWLNLPSSEKMTAPKYQEFGPDRIPMFAPLPNVLVRLIAGSLGGIEGPVRQPATEPVYLDATVAPSSDWSLEIPAGHSAFVYVFEGDMIVGEGEAACPISKSEMGLLANGTLAKFHTGLAGARFLFVAARPLMEPVARLGPFVMNSREEIREALEDLQMGRF